MPACIRAPGILDINCNTCHQAPRYGGRFVVEELRKLAAEGWRLGYFGGRWVMICPTCTQAAERMLEMGVARET